MNHADNLVLPGHGWAVASWTVVIIAAILGFASSQTPQVIATRLQSDEHPVASAAKELTTTARLAIAHQNTFPIVLTIPFAVTRTQRMMVARVKHRAEVASHGDQLRGAPNGAPRLLTGLALLGASQSPNH